MDDTSKVIVVITVFGFMAFTVRSIVTLIRARIEAHARPSGVSAETEQRIARIEQAVDAIAIEVERIAEGQRFTTRLLAERGQEPAALPSSRSQGA
ncbi:MAG TPA: hypothetical protein VG818_13035 [Gemmatimonadaceae bacterium]|jgi:hypothetical protein|nr:hypothetical protein [Gemmatimonadaceae bacterium]